MGPGTTHKHAPKVKATPACNSAPKAAGPSDLPSLQDNRIHWNGEAIAVVLAETQEEADYAQWLIHATDAIEAALVEFDDAHTNAEVPSSGLEMGKAEGREGG